ncbi:MAG: xanthine dehydrogenase family protein subunit M [Deltaproteobacteria bacterium]|nr:xanthine dehydrogenase family protein subunit M [Deltaproteobacteria bacterium]MBW2665982.1 xanthine dehydrogenase family protein subunit M [Deltaproteobacteria bacterium]
MKPPPFEYEAPTTIQEVVALLQQHDGEAKILAGGQSLMPLLNMRFARPTALIDLGRMTDLDYIREENGAIAIGAMTTKRSVERSDLVKSRQPLLHASTTWIAHPQIRNRGTVGGSMAQADPAAEYPAVAVALDAEFVIAGPDGQRSVAASDFFITYLTTALKENEVLTEIRVPVLPERTGWSIQEVARRHGDFAMVGAVAILGLAGGSCESARVVLFGVGATPQRATSVEQALIGQAASEALFATAAEKAAEGLEDTISDVHASAEYRRHLAQVLTRRALAEAAERA